MLRLNDILLTASVLHTSLASSMRSSRRIRHKYKAIELVRHTTMERGRRLVVDRNLAKH